MRTRILATLLLTLACVLALNAKRSMTPNVEVAPNPVQSGEALSITSSLTNNTDEVQTMSASLQMSGPCGVTASRGYKVLLNGHQTDTSKASFQAPACAGDYRAVLTVSGPDGVILGKASVGFAVSPRTPNTGSK